MPRPSTCHMAIGICSKRCRYRCSLARSISSARLRSVMSRTKATPSSCFHSKSARAIRIGTRLPSLRKYSFSRGCTVPNVFSSAKARSSASRHSAGVSSVHRSRPETRSSRAYPTISRKAWLASMIRPWTSQITIPMMFESTRPRILASRSLRSLYRRAFSSEIAA